MLSRGKPEPSTALFGVLGLLAVRPMSTYELAKHFDRSLGRVWPRARSKLFEAPKRLEELGLARSTPGLVGRRPRTVYSITPKGRRALATWLARPGSGPELEFEQLLKVFFAEHASTEAAVTNLEAARDWARAQIDEHIAVGRAYLEGTGTFQERLAVNLIAGTFLARFAMTVEQWATWALGVVQSWPDDPRKAAPNIAALEQVVRELESIRTSRR
ncbi:MAG: helix-turn-helix transcriptional regulator [Actinomycetota bacterium]|nr:PadR family transcriptional regulator [Actinomycetota bacterium]